MSPRIHSLDHVGIVVDDLDDAAALLERLALARDGGTEREELRTAFFSAPRGPRVEVIEVVEPEMRERRLGAATARIEHVAFEVEELAAAVAALGALGIELEGPPREGGGYRSVWTRPDSSDGVMIQFMERLRPPVTLPPATADLMDEHGDAAGSCELQLVQFGRRRAFSGEIATVRCHEDNVLVKATLSERGEGRVLVVDGGGSLRTALVGDKIATLAVDNGWAGLVIWGAVRDTRALADIDLGVKALGSNPRRSAKVGAGETSVPVSFGGVTFVPGHLLVSDDDGIVVLAP